MNSAPGRGSAAIRAAPSTQSDMPGPLRATAARGSRRNRAVLPRVAASANSRRSGPSRTSALTGIATGPTGPTVARTATIPSGSSGMVGSAAIPEG